VQEIGISVIMPSYLGKYEGSRINADQKFIRAVESFQQQTLQNKELIIVSDGCEITNRIYRELFQYDTEEPQGLGSSGRAPVSVSRRNVRIG